MVHTPAGASRKAVAKTPKEAGQRFKVLCSPSPAPRARESLKGVPSTMVELIKYMKNSKLIMPCLPLLYEMNSVKTCAEIYVPYN